MRPGYLAPPTDVPRHDISGISSSPSSTPSDAVAPDDAPLTELPSPRETSPEEASDSPTSGSAPDVARFSDRSSRPPIGPTEAGDPCVSGQQLEAYYPYYGACINDCPAPRARPTFPTLLACCTTVYGGQFLGE